MRPLAVERPARAGRVRRAAEDLVDLTSAVRDADELLSVTGSVALEGGLVLVRLGEPRVGGLRLVFDPATEPSAELATLETFGFRAHAVRAGERMSDLAELERSRALLAVVGQAIAEALARTLETAVDRVGELLETDRAAVYLRQAGGLEAAVRARARRPARPCRRGLLDLILERLRARPVVEIRDATSDPRLGSVRDAVSESGIEAAVVVPLRAAGRADRHARRLFACRSGGSARTSRCCSLPSRGSSRSQFRTPACTRTRHGWHERQEALDAELLAAKRLEAFYEISRSFSESLSLEDRRRDRERRSSSSTSTPPCCECPTSAATPWSRVQSTFPMRARRRARPDPAPAAAARRIEAATPVVLTPRRAKRLGGGHELLVPFLERGSTASLVPIVSAGEVMAALTLISLDPAADRRRGARGRARPRRPGSARDRNARLYEQQVHFADAMQRSLLPDEPPDMAGIEIGSVYESSSRLDVGGDVFDYTVLPDGRLVVVGDVTGKGIDAADAAMTKFVFRSLAREHPEPSELMRIANQVVLDEVEEGKFVTMLYLTLDPATGELLLWRRSSRAAGRAAGRSRRGAGGTRARARDRA